MQSERENPLVIATYSWFLITGDYTRVGGSILP